MLKQYLVKNAQQSPSSFAYFPYMYDIKVIGFFLEKNPLITSNAQLLHHLQWRLDFFLLVLVMIVNEWLMHTTENKGLELLIETDQLAQIKLDH